MKKKNFLYRATLVVAVFAGCSHFVVSTGFSAEENMVEEKKHGSQDAVTIGEAWQHKFPEQIVLVVSQGEEGPANIMTAGWTMPCSGNPPSIAVAIGKARYSHGLIEQTRQFVVAFPGDDLEKEMLFCGTKSGRDFDKFAETGLTARPSMKIKPPLIEECIVNFECEMTHAVDVGSHTIFVGRIVQAWRHAKADEMKRIYSLGGQGGRRFGGLPLDRE